MTLIGRAGSAKNILRNKDAFATAYGVLMTTKHKSGQVDFVFFMVFLKIKLCQEVIIEY